MSYDSKAGNNAKEGPPSPPWIPIVHGTSGKAALSFYYSDPLSKVPIRDISHKNDPKADPNLETATFGRFSICDRGMRATIVKQGIELHFFCTSRCGPHGSLRVLTGYYRYGWYLRARDMAKTLTRSKLEDYMLVAREMRFVSPGFPLCDLTGYLWGEQLDRPFRTFRYIDEKTAVRLLHLINEAPDTYKEYLSEICRIEELVKKRDKMLYRKRSEGFSWTEAVEVARDKET
jgi:hypothetical protein